MDIIITLIITVIITIDITEVTIINMYTEESFLKTLADIYKDGVSCYVNFNEIYLREAIRYYLSNGFMRMSKGKYILTKKGITEVIAAKL